MNTLPKTALVALVAGTIGLTAAVPATFAQDASTPQPQVRHHQQFGGNMNHPGVKQRPGMQGRNFHRPPMARPGMGPKGLGSLVNVACSPRGAEALEIAFVRVSYRLDLNDAQQPLFDDLRTAALDAQKNFADTCQAARPARTAGTPDPLAAYKARVAVASAHLDALNTVMPKFEAFVGSLDDAQKAKLMPQRPGRHGQAPGQQPAAPMAPAAPEAPAAPPAAPQG